MKLDRATIKMQARELIKGNVFNLFLIMFIVGIITSAVSGIFSLSSDIDDIKSLTGNKSSQSFSLDDIDDLDDLDDFDLDDDDIIGGSDVPAVSAVSNVGSGIGVLLSIALAPLAITLLAVFLFLIKGQRLSLGDGLTYVFKNTFNKNYLNLFLHELLKSIFLGLLCCLFIVPGIVYCYKWYFSEMILAENPEMNWKDAMDLSKKMTNGHKGELFVLDLSFILWGLLCAVTAGIASIYVGPYYITTKALYFENFRQRGFSNGELNPYDFAAKPQPEYTAPQQNYQPYQAPAMPNQYQAPVQQPQQNGYYQPPVQQPQQNEYYQPPVQQNEYYQPPQE